MAAYVLDALEPDESADLRRHLAGCEICRAELADLEWIPQLLPLVELADLDGLERSGGVPPDLVTPPALLDRLIADTSPERRGPRGPRANRLAALVGAAALAAGISGLAAVSDLPASTGTHHARSAATVQATDPQTHVSAAVTVSERSWGTQLGLTLTGAYPGGTCSLVAHADDGRKDTAATWVASSTGTARVPGATAIPAGHLIELDVVTVTGHQLVRIIMPH